MHRFLLSFLFLGFFAFSVHAQSGGKKKRNKSPQIVEASCGTCNFGMEGDGCRLAVRMDGKAYFVIGSDLSEHGDEHGEDGMCNKIRQAKVEGKVVMGMYKAKSFELLPLEEAEE